jgi:periplasmic protein CpxP/Spy
MISKPIVKALALAFLIGGGSGAMVLATDRAVAESTAGAQSGPTDQARHERHAAVHRARLEGRIAALRAELGITDAQQPLWDKVALAMREAAEQRAQFRHHRTPDQARTRSAIERLEAGVHRAALSAQAKERFLAAFKPLYDSFSEQQKKIADDLFAPHHHFGRH